ncbi:MAG: phage holin family protein [Clostridiales bacterium]|nr:phage holin family protein [Clostridiales bacterium]
MDKLKEILYSNNYLFNRLSIDFSVIGGVLVWFLGGADALLTTLLSMVIVDYLTGVVKAIYLKKLSSNVGFKGIIKKFVIFLVVGMSTAIQRIMPEVVPIREITIMFFICNEGLSVLENASVMIPLPKKLKSVLLQLRRSSQQLYENTPKKSKTKLKQKENDDKKSLTSQNNDDKNSTL